MAHGQVDKFARTMALAVLLESALALETTGPGSSTGDP